MQNNQYTQIDTVTTIVLGCGDVSISQGIITRSDGKEISAIGFDVIDKSEIGATLDPGPPKVHPVNIIFENIEGFNVLMEMLKKAKRKILKLSKNEN